MNSLMDFSLSMNKAKHQWIEKWLTSSVYLVAAFSVTTLQMIVMPILFALHIHRLRHGNTRKKSRSRYQNNDDPLRIKYIIIDNVSLASIAFSFMSGIITVSNYASAFGRDSCRLMTITQNLFWLFTKVSIYIVVLLRLQCAFCGSAFQLNQRFYQLCFVTIALFTIILSVGTALPYPIGVDSKDIDGTGFCLLIIPFWLILTPLIFDICCSLVSMYLFIKPIRKIMTFSAENSNVLSKLLTKYILMSSIAIFSNLFSSIWFAVTDILIFTYCDVFINPICLVLMQIHHDDIYFALCKHCHSGLHKVIKFPEPERDLNIEQIQSPSSVKSQKQIPNTKIEKVEVPAVSPSAGSVDISLDKVPSIGEQIEGCSVQQNHD